MHADSNSGELKVTLITINNLGGHSQKWAYPLKSWTVKSATSLE